MDELQQIQAQIATLQEQANQLLIKKKAEVISEIKSKIKAYGLSSKDLGLESVEGKSRQTVAIKYRLDANTWTGRGRKPKFVEDYLATGGSLEDLLVK